MHYISLVCTEFYLQPYSWAFNITRSFCRLCSSAFGVWLQGGTGESNEQTCCTTTQPLLHPLIGRDNQHPPSIQQGWPWPCPEQPDPMLSPALLGEGQYQGDRNNSSTTPLQTPQDWWRTRSPQQKPGLFFVKISHLYLPFTNPIH